MKQFPVLDSRTKQDLLAQIAARARRYTPEWRLDFEQPDAGAALAPEKCHSDDTVGETQLVERGKPLKR